MTMALIRTANKAAIKFFFFFFFFFLRDSRWWAKGIDRIAGFRNPSCTYIENQSRHESCRKVR